jgi:hypothetical protein
MIASRISDRVSGGAEMTDTVLHASSYDIKEPEQKAEMHENDREMRQQQQK